MKQALIFPCLFVALFSSAVQGFQAKKQTNQEGRASVIPFSIRSTGDSSFPQNATTAATPTNKKKTVYLNQDYVSPVKVVPTPVNVGRAKKPTTATRRTRSTLVGGYYFMEMGDSIQQIHDNKLLREAGVAFQDIGRAWQEGDWEAVTYSAHDASQTMKLVAQSLNKRHWNNNLQQAYAGIAGELLVLSNSKHQPKAINLQGLSLSLYQASRNTKDDDQTSRLLEQASRSAQSLAKKYGANSSYLPRRFQLWWHDRKQRNNNKYDETAFE